MSFISKSYQRDHLNVDITACLELTAECTDLKSFLKNVNCRTFKDFNFNVLTPQKINKR